VRGFLITLEGIDGSGKTTALKTISRRLAELIPERQVVLTVEPTASRAGEILRTELSKHSQPIDSQTSMAISEATSKAGRMEELFLFMADHSYHLVNTVIPSLMKGCILISDRYADSTSAYQGVTLKGIVPEPVDWIRSLHQPWNVVPDLTLLFDLDVNLALERIGARPGSRDKFEKEDFLKEVRKNFRYIAGLEPGRFRVIDAGLDPDEVAKEAMDAIIDLVSPDRARDLNI